MLPRTSRTLTRCRAARSRTVFSWVGEMSKTVVCAPSLAKMTGSQPPPAARPRTRAPSSFTPFRRPRGSMKRRIPALVLGGRPKGRGWFIAAFATRPPISLVCSAIRGAAPFTNRSGGRPRRGGLPHAVAVKTTRRRIAAPRRAGVRRIVQTSIANPTASTSSYYRGKAALEDVVRSSGLSYAIVRPTLLFGEGDVLINNIAWLLRHIPVFGIPGTGRYRLQPMHVKDHAGLLVEVGSELAEVVVDSAGPEIFTFDELVHLLRRALKLRTVVIHVPPALAMVGATMAGRIA